MVVCEQYPGFTEHWYPFTHKATRGATTLGQSDRAQATQAFQELPSAWKLSESGA